MEVSCLATSAITWRGCEISLDEVSCLAAWARTPRDSWQALMRVPTDWAIAEIDRLWEGSLIAVKALKGSPSI